MSIKSQKTGARCDKRLYRVHCFAICCPKTGSCPSKPLLLLFKVVSSKTREYQCFEVCCTATSSCASKPLLLRYQVTKRQCLCQVPLELKEVQMGAHDFKLNKVPHFRSTTCEYYCFKVCCPKTSSCASKSLFL